MSAALCCPPLASCALARSQTGGTRAWRARWAAKGSEHSQSSEEGVPSAVHATLRHEPRRGMAHRLVSESRVASWDEKPGGSLCRGAVLSLAAFVSSRERSRVSVSALEPLEPARLGGAGPIPSDARRNAMLFLRLRHTKAGRSLGMSHAQNERSSAWARLRGVAGRHGPA